MRCYTLVLMNVYMPFPRCFILVLTLCYAFLWLFEPRKHDHHTPSSCKLASLNSHPHRKFWYSTDSSLSFLFLFLLLSSCSSCLQRRCPLCWSSCSIRCTRITPIDFRPMQFGRSLSRPKYFRICFVVTAPWLVESHHRTQPWEWSVTDLWSSVMVMI